MNAVFIPPIFDVSILADFFENHGFFGLAEGNYKQDFKVENPDNPDDTEIITETISLNGPTLAITLKYLL